MVIEFNANATIDCNVCVFVGEDELIGLTVSNIIGMENGNKKIKISFTDGTEYQIEPASYGCDDARDEGDEPDTFENIVGNPDKLVGKTITDFCLVEDYNDTSKITICAGTTTITMDAGFWEDPYGGHVTIKKTKLKTEPIEIGNVELSSEINAMVEVNAQFAHEIEECLYRHSHCDWGYSDYKFKNTKRAREGKGGLLSKYKTSKGDIEVATSADRKKTVIVFEEEYFRAVYPEILWKEK